MPRPDLIHVLELVHEASLNICNRLKSLLIQLTHIRWKHELWCSWVRMQDFQTGHHILNCLMKHSMYLSSIGLFASLTSFPVINDPSGLIPIPQSLLHGYVLCWWPYLATEKLNLLVLSNGTYPTIGIVIKGFTEDSMEYLMNWSAVKPKVGFPSAGVPILSYVGTFHIKGVSGRMIISPPVERVAVVLVESGVGQVHSKD